MLRCFFLRNVWCSRKVNSIFEKRYQVIGFNLMLVPVDGSVLANSNLSRTFRVSSKIDTKLAFETRKEYEPIFRMHAFLGSHREGSSLPAVLTRFHQLINASRQSAAFRTLQDAAVVTNFAPGALCFSRRRRKNDVLVPSREPSAAEYERSANGWEYATKALVTRSNF